MDITSLFDISKQIADLYRENLLKDGMLETGKLYNFTWNVEFNGEIFQLQFNLPKEWYFVEHGRNPSQKMPPVDSIEQWIRIKKIVPRAKNGKVPSTRSLAFAISKKIQKKGFYDPNHQGKNTLQRTLQDSSDYIKELANKISSLLSKEVSKDLVSIFDGMENFTPANGQ